MQRAGRLRLASIGFLVACSPAPSPRPVSAELDVPPIVDAGAPVARPAPTTSPEPPAKSAEELEREECREVMHHVAEVQLDASGIAPEQRKQVLESILQSMDTMTEYCPFLDGTMRKCMLAARTSNDITSCAAAGAASAQSPVAPPPPPTTRPPRPPRPARPKQP